MHHNGRRYGLLPISKLFPIKLHLLLIRAETLECTLDRQLTIALVMVWRLFPALRYCGSAIKWQILIVLFNSVETTMIPVDF